MNFLHDLRYAVQTLLRAPGFTLLVVLTLALGIGGNTALFSVFHGAVLAPLPFPEPERLIRLCSFDEATSTSCSASGPDIMDWSERSKSFEKIGLARSWPLLLRGTEGLEIVNGGLVTPGFFQALRLHTVSGRLFEEQEVGPNGPKVAILTYNLWQEKFGGDPAVIERSVILNDESYTIVGVLPPVDIPELQHVKLWVPLHLDPRDEESRSRNWFKALGRLAPGVELSAAQSEMQSVAAQIAQEHPETREGWSVRLVPFHERLVGSARSDLLPFLGAVGFVLLIGCTNVANMLFARLANRRREFALRSALGAPRLRLVTQVLAESLVLALAGGLGGLVLAWWGVKVLKALGPPGIPRLAEVTLNAPVLGFAVLVSLLSSLLCGFLPALRSTKLDLVQELKEGSPGAGSRSAIEIRNLLIVVEVGLAVVLLIGAGLLTRSLGSAARWDGGFDDKNLLTMWLVTSTTKYTEESQVAQLYQQILTEVATLPAVEAVGGASAGPLFGGNESEGFSVVGRGDRPAEVRWYDVSPEYFQTLGLALKKGRYFTEQDRDSAPRVAIINETLAKRLWPDADPIGQQVQGDRNHPDPFTVVGVVGDVTPLTPEGKAQPEIYWPFLQYPRWATYLLLRTHNDPESAVKTVRGRLHELDPDLTIANVATFEQLLAKQLVLPRFQATLVNVFAFVALVRVIGGTYGVIASSVVRQTRDIGLRMALGAGRWRVLRMIIGRGALLVAIGIVLGLTGAMALTRFVESMLYGISPTDPSTLLSMTGILLFMAILASLIPAWRATRIDPLWAIRYE